ncbi:MAG: hypothetical protein DRR19_19020, partial [Candidatus Parabeggiatoa sp. nov. 1]
MNDPIPKFSCQVILMLSCLLTTTSDIVSAAVLDAGNFICGIQADNTLVGWGGGGTPPSVTFSQISIGWGQGG